MNNIDLNIENYNLDELLKLFHLDTNLTQEDLKKAKRKVLKMHPDKSKLDKKFFIFFCNAYKLVYQLYEFKGLHHNKKNKQEQLDTDESEEHKNLIKDLQEKKGKNFNRWFNEMFDKSQLSDLTTSNGHGDWLKSSDNINTITANNISEVNNHIENKKKELRSIIKIDDIQEQDYNNGYELLDSEISEYSSGLFSSLAYDDVKKVHTETVIAVTNDDYKNHKKYSNVEEMKQMRNTQNTTPPSLQQARQYLENKNQNQNNISTHRAYELAKQYEKNREKNKEWWATLKRLT